MSLRDIQENLYKKDKPENLSEHQISEYDPTSAKDTGEMGKISQDLWAQKNGLGQAEKKVIKKGAIFFLFVLAIIIGMVIFSVVRQILFQAGKSVISITGPIQAQSGKLLTYEINYKNDNQVDLKNVVFKINYPENFNPEEDQNFKSDSLTSGSIELGTIKKKSGGKIILNGRAYSPKGALIYLKVSMLYTPSSYSGQFQESAQLGISIDTAPITLEVLAPQNVSSGDAVDYQINYKNDGEETLDNLKIKADYPDQFTFSSASPKASADNNVWDIGSLAPNQSGKIVISGKLEGERENIKTIEAAIGVLEQNDFVSFNSESADTRIISSPLSIAQTVNKQKELNVNSGDFLEFQIDYKNNGNIGLRNVIITEKIDSPVLDYSTLKLKGGSFDIDSKIITWKASDIKELANLGVNQGGSIFFSVRVKEIFPVGEEKDKNFVIKTIAKIDSPDIPTPISMNKIISSNEINMKVNSKLVVSVKGFYNDPNIPNTGPVPPKVGQETTYTIRWKVLNISNDVSEAQVLAILPTNAEMTSKIYPEDARLEYNSRTNTINWTIGNMKSGTGLLSPSPEVAFQVKIKPSPDQVNREVDLLGKTTIIAKDLFTGDNLIAESPGKNTNLPEDSFLLGKNRITN